MFSQEHPPQLRLRYDGQQKSGRTGGAAWPPVVAHDDPVDQDRKERREIPFGNSRLGCKREFVWSIGTVGLATNIDSKISDSHWVGDWDDI